MSSLRKREEAKKTKRNHGITNEKITILTKSSADEEKNWLK